MTDVSENLALIIAALGVILIIVAVMPIIIRSPIRAREPVPISITLVLLFIGAVFVLQSRFNDILFSASAVSVHVRDVQQQVKETEASVIELQSKIEASEQTVSSLLATIDRGKQIWQTITPSNREFPQPFTKALTESLRSQGIDLTEDALNKALNDMWVDIPVGAGDVEPGRNPANGGQ